ncbi:MAG: LysR family transcriptional regulator [Hyphomicrobiaceae bacterium]|nr:LysR family transcriptional regulator [Hyphomicrobiaceae bacterium]MCC0010591.1 LysR family transcriptional regulator [Hyphomicrobiaceae bacterium]
MAKHRFNDLLWFLALAKERSFTRSAAKLGVAQSTLSHTIKRLETDMGIRLLARTTRSVALTEAGKRLFEALAPRIEEIEDNIAELTAFRDRPSGSIRITLSQHALRTVVWPKLKPVLKIYPDIHLELDVDNGFRNIVEDGYDAGVRLGESIEKDMVAVRIGPDLRLVAVASPDYLANVIQPVHPQDLIGHACINRRQSSGGGLYAWEFAKDGQDIRVKVEGQLTFNDTETMIDAAMNGYGIAFVPYGMVEGSVAAGHLAIVLGDWSPPFEGYYIYYPSKRQNSPAFRIIVDALKYKAP